MKQKAGWIPRCADCTIENTICSQEDGKGPAYCPTLHMADVVKASLKEYKNPDIKAFAANATIQEGECYVNKERDDPNKPYTLMHSFLKFILEMSIFRHGLCLIVSGWV